MIKSSCESMNSWKICMWSFCYLFLIPPNIFTYIPLISKYDVYLKSAIIISIAGLYIKEIIKKGFHDKFLLYYNIYAFVTILSSLFNHNSLKTAVWSNFIIANSIIILTLVSAREDILKLFKTLYYLYSIIIVLNLISVIFCTDRSLMETRYILGNYNRFISYYLIPLVCGYYLVLKEEISWIGYTALYFICLIELAVLHSVTATILLVIWGCAATVVFHSKVIKLFSLKLVYVVHGLLFIFLQTYNPQNDLVIKILSLLQKNATMSGRYEIWLKTREWIRRYPIIGTGIDDKKEIILEKIGNVNPHNTILNILFQSGILGLVAWMLLMLEISKKIISMDDVRIKGITITFVFSFFLLGQFEVISIFFLSIYLALIVAIAENESIKVDNK